MPKLLRKTSGFTLVELMIVMSIIAMLLGLSMFPYMYYIQRGYVEKSVDAIGQEWILAHKAVRNGILFDTNKHARILVIFTKGSNEVKEYLFSGTTMSLADDFTDATKFKLYRTVMLDGKAEIVGFTGQLSPDFTQVGYLITPPSGTGAFFTGSTVDAQSLTGAQILIGYRGADLDTGRLRRVLLRPYLQ